MSRRTWKECTLFMFYCTINHEENSFSLPLWSIGRIPSKKTDLKKVRRNGYGMQISERILIWQERSIFGNIWQELVGFTILTSTILSLKILKRYRILNWWTVSEIKPIVYLFVTNEVSYQYQGGKLVIVWKCQYPYQGGLYHQLSMYFD